MLESRPPGRIRFQLLGPAGLFAGHSDTALRLSTQKGFALLAYLAMNAGRPVGRAVLADLLWGDRGEAQARQSLRQAVLTLRRDLGANCAASLNVDDQSLSLAVGTDDVDALQFAAWAASPDPVQRQRCLEIPWAPFLANVSVDIEPFDAWVVAERHRLDAIATRVFSDLARQFDAAGDGERAILALERLIAIDPTEEERHRRLLALEARYRGPDAALARGRELAAMLKREVDAEQEPATIALLEDIRRKEQTAAHVGAPVDRRTGDRPAPVETGDNPAPDKTPLPHWLRWGLEQELRRSLPTRGIWKLAAIAGLLVISLGATSYLFWRSPPTSAKAYSASGNFACFAEAEYPASWRDEAPFCGPYGCNFGKMPRDACLALGARKQSKTVIHGNAGTSRANECWLQHYCGDLREHGGFTLFRM